MIRTSLALALTILTGALATPSADSATGGTLTVHITNVRNARGEVHAEVCPQALFLKDDCPWSASAPAHVGVTVVTIRGVPAGQYAVQTFHDENLNHKVDRNFLGIPKEGVGFSNDALHGMSRPKWADAVFAFAGGEQTIQLKTRYFL